MSFLPSLPEARSLADVFCRFPDSSKPLLDYRDLVLRGSPALGAAERALIAAYVSGINNCPFEYAGQGAAVDQAVLLSLLQDVESANVPARLKPIMRYVRKLTLVPARVGKSDVDAILAAGWNEEAVFDAAQVCALFNFINRMTEGTGVGVLAVQKMAGR